MSAIEYYDHTTFPSQGAAGSSAAMRAELENIEAGFAKLPDLSGNGNKVVLINPGATGMTVAAATGTGDFVRGISPTLVTPTIGQANFTSVGAYAVTFTFTGITGVTFPTTGTLATLAGAETLTNKTLTSPVINSPTGITAANIANTPAGGVTGVTVQAAINELDTEKATLSSSQSESPYAATTGTANAIVLTTAAIYPARTAALTVGSQVRFRATSANTAAATINWDGQGVINCRTVTNVALPAGYIRTDIDTVATYDGANFVLQREIERGSNANGEYVRFADGTQICTAQPNFAAHVISTASGSLFYGSPPSATFAAAFSTTPTVGVGVLSAGGLSWCSISAVSTTLVSYFTFSTASKTEAVTFEVLAVGRWF